MKNHIIKIYIFTALEIGLIINFAFHEDCS